MTQMSGSVPRPRRWPIYLPFGLLVALAAIWSGAWFYLAGRAPAAIAEWRAREATSGRSYDCSHQSIAGFPFRIEVQCTAPSVTLTRTAPPFVLDAESLLVAWQVYQPTLVIAELAGPLLLGEPGAAATFRAGSTGSITRRGSSKALQAWPSRSMQVPGFHPAAPSTRPANPR